VAVEVDMGLLVVMVGIFSLIQINNLELVLVLIAELAEADFEAFPMLLTFTPSQGGVSIA
tara:strand:- start:214 stop:393 length:180 start_codon:yes stop_codon:yes gene_type:complete